MKKARSTGTLALLLALTLILGCVTGGTLAWLTAKTGDVVNTFTYGDINIELTETTGSSYHIVPGADISKNPTVKVRNDSEDCWLFVKVVEEGTFVNDKVTYAIADGWEPVTGQTNVYYRQVKSTDAVKAFSVLAGNKITVKNTLTKEEANAAASAKLTFTAYAIQESAATTADAAWALVPKN